MRIIQLTDIHVGMPGQDTRGVDTRMNLTTILDKIKEAAPDRIVLSGDVCYREPREEVCNWVSGQFESRGMNPYVITGNHDESVMINECFGMPLAGDEVYYSELWQGVKCLFLDTGKGVMSEAQWTWLREELTYEGRVVIFAHHPPVYAHVPYMDNNHAFAEIDRFQSAIADRKSDVHLFCGHYHVSKSISIGNLHVHITPSCFFQIRDDIQDFGVAGYDIAYREIRLDADGVYHSVKWI